MAEIDVHKTGEDASRLAFHVTVREGSSSSEHDVTLSRDDFQGIDAAYSSPEEFVTRCFEFLLEREPKESILGRFDIRDIARYFPEFDTTFLRPPAR